MSKVKLDEKGKKCIVSLSNGGKGQPESHKNGRSRGLGKFSCGHHAIIEAETIGTGGSPQ